MVFLPGRDYKYDHFASSGGLPTRDCRSIEYRKKYIFFSNYLFRRTHFSITRAMGASYPTVQTLPSGPLLHFVTSPLKYLHLAR